MGYGYYDRRKVDMISDPAWEILAKEHRELEGIDLARFTIELDDAVGEIFELVSTVFGELASSRLKTDLCTQRVLRFVSIVSNGTN
jgi:hypothetical protein